MPASQRPPNPQLQDLMPATQRPWLTQLQSHLEQLQAQHNLRTLRPTVCQGPLIRVDGQDLINLSSNDYLGLAQHPALIAAAQAATAAHGAGQAASRLLSGHGPLHQQAEAAFARFKHAPAALLLPTGYLANLALLTSLAGPGDLICLDKLCHASLVDAARASGAQIRVFPHLQTEKLERLLQRPARGNSPETSDPAAPGRPQRKLIVTDSVFSMDGDVADLPELCRVARNHDALLIVDEAHGTGVLGEQGRGLCQWQQVSHLVDAVVSTASKALGGLGGIVTSSELVIQTLVNHARCFIYSTATPAAQPAALLAALQVVAQEPWRRQRLHDISRELRENLHRGQISGPPPAVSTPIIPIVTGSSEAALNLAQRLQQKGYFAPAIRPPTVAPGSARVRLVLRADLEQRHLDGLIDVLRQWRGEVGG